MTKRTGVGIIGAGTISDEYLGNLTRFPALEVRFIADLDTDRAAAQAAKWGVPASGATEQLLADPDVDIVVNLTIPAVHVEVAKQAVAAGKHVWGEKPYALDRESARELAELAHSEGVRVAVAPDTFLGPGLQTALRAVKEGTIGTPVSGLALFQTPGPESWHPSPEFLFARGAGPMFDVGPYYLTALVQVFGAARRVSATGSKARETRVIGSGPKAGREFPVEVPTHVNALIEFESGASALAVFSFDSQLRHTVIEIEGTDGAAAFPDPNMFEGDTVLHLPGDETRTIAAGRAASTRGTGVAEFAEAIRTGRRERVPGELAIHVLDIMVSISEAIDAGTPVDVASTVEASDLLDLEWDPTVDPARAAASST